MNSRMPDPVRQSGLIRWYASEDEANEAALILTRTYFPEARRIPELDRPNLFAVTIEFTERKPLMSFRMILPGSTITRTYYAVPDHYTIGDSFDNWDDAVRAAQAKRLKLIEDLTKSLEGFSTPEEITTDADAQVCIELRWVIEVPDGTKPDMPVERYYQVANLRTTAEKESTQ